MSGQVTKYPPQYQIPVTSLIIRNIPYVSVAFFPSLKQNFMAYRSSKVSSCPDYIFEIHQLWQSGFSRVYSIYCCSCLFEPEIIKICQSSHKMYSNNIVNFQESTTILNACTKKSGNLLNAPRIYRETINCCLPLDLWGVPRYTQCSLVCIRESFLVPFRILSSNGKDAFSFRHGSSTEEDMPFYLCSLRTPFFNCWEWKSFVVLVLLSSSCSICSLSFVENFPCAVAKVLDCDLEVGKFKLQSRCYVYFWTNTLGKGMNLLIPSIID